MCVCYKETNRTAERWLYLCVCACVVGPPLHITETHVLIVIHNCVCVTACGCVCVWVWVPTGLEGPKLSHPGLKLEVELTPDWASNSTRTDLQLSSNSNWTRIGSREIFARKPAPRAITWAGVVTTNGNR